MTDFELDCEILMSQHRCYRHHIYAQEQVLLLLVYPLVVTQLSQPTSR